MRHATKLKITTKLKGGLSPACYNERDAIAVMQTAIAHLFAPEHHRIVEQTAFGKGILRGIESLNEVYSEFFLYYDGAPLLIVNASEIDLVNGDRDYEHLVDYMLDIRNGRHYFNPTFL